MKKSELIKRYLLFILGLFFAGLGVAFSKHSELGVSPVSSVANVLSFRFPALSIGYWLIIWNCVLILGQILILRRDFQLYQLLQIPLSVLFGYFTDFGVWLVSFIPVPNYFVKLVMLAMGIIVLAFGIALAVIANVILNSGEAFVKAVADKTKFEFGNVKVAFDVGCVLTAVVPSMIFFRLKIVGTREGTVITAITTGFVVKFFTRACKDKIEGLLT